MSQDKVYVRDESFSDESFLKFKVQLVKAVVEKNTSILFSLLGDKVRLSNDDGCITTECIIEMFEKSLNNENGDYMWNDMYRALKYGFSINQDNSGKTFFEAPSFIKHMGVEERGKLLILGFNVNIREEPDTNSKILRTASYGLIPYHGIMSSTPPKRETYVDGKWWYEVILEDSQLGYIISELATEGSERNIRVDKINGEWKITALYQPPGC